MLRAQRLAIFSVSSVAALVVAALPGACRSSQSSFGDPPTSFDGDGVDAGFGDGGDDGDEADGGESFGDDTDGGTPSFGATVTQAVSPPPISGGTLLVSRDGTLAVAADPDRDQVYVVNLATSAVTTLALQAGDEPGRLVEDGAARVHVAARSGGVVVSIDLATQTVIARRPVCAAPRGVAYDGTTNDLYVACATGELVTLSAAGGPPLRTVFVDRDLRDVLVGADGTPYVTRLKTAEVITLAADGSIASRHIPPTASTTQMGPGSAWRTIQVAPSAAYPSGGFAMVHQRSFEGVVDTSPGGYGNSVSDTCEPAIVESTITLFTGGTSADAPSAAIASAVLPVDIAASADGSLLAVVAAGNVAIPGAAGVFLIPTLGVAPSPVSMESSCATATSFAPPGQPTAVAFTKTAMLVQTREPAWLYALQLGEAAIPAPIVLSTVSRADTGHEIFHSNSGASIACASCHAEGLEDGRVWQFDQEGHRRSQSLRGTLQGTAPYHWDGKLTDIPNLAQEVFVQRMGGIPLDSDEVTALQSWLFSLPAPPASPASDAASVARGQALFTDSSVGCSSCHSGPKLTNDQTMDVGTGGGFQVPSLVGVGWRAPFLHDGCAATLAARFSAPCDDGVSHGHTASLTAAQVSDLVNYLTTL